MSNPPTSGVRQTRRTHSLTNVHLADLMLQGSKNSKSTTTNQEIVQIREDENENQEISCVVPLSSNSSSSSSAEEHHEHQNSSFSSDFDSSQRAHFSASGDEQEINQRGNSSSIEWFIDEGDRPLQSSQIPPQTPPVPARKASQRRDAQRSITSFFPPNRTISNELVENIINRDQQSSAAVPSQGVRDTPDPLLISPYDRMVDLSESIENE